MLACHFFKDLTWEEILTTIFSGGIWPNFLHQHVLLPVIDPKSHFLAFFFRGPTWQKKSYVSMFFFSKIWPEGNMRITHFLRWNLTKLFAPACSPACYCPKKSLFSIFLGGSNLVKKSHMLACRFFQLTGPKN